jgi:hypothetical protein
MRKLVLVCASLFTMVLSISASPVLAQNVLFVSPLGNDANACSETAPCVSFQRACSQLAYNRGSVSQINCLGAEFYGPITITGSLTIDCATGNVENIVIFSNRSIRGIS